MYNSQSFDRSTASMMEQIIPANRFDNSTIFNPFRWLLGYRIDDGLTEQFGLSYTQAVMQPQRTDYNVNYLQYVTSGDYQAQTELELVD